MAVPPPAGTAPAVPAPAGAGPLLSTRDAAARPCVELGVMYGQAVGGREPVLQALTNLQAIGQQHGCDAIIAVKLLHYATAAGPTIVAYGTGVRFVPAPAVARPAAPAPHPAAAAATGHAPNVPAGQAE